MVYEKINDEWYNGEFKGKFGIFPVSYVQPTDSNAPPLQSPTAVKTATALFDYNSGVEEDLLFCANDVIEIVEEMDGGEWIRGRLHGRTGLVPLTYVRRN